MDANNTTLHNATHNPLVRNETLCSNFIWTHMENQKIKTTHFHTFSLAIGGLSIVGCMFNLYVLVRIVSQGVRRSHFSKIYYLSLAVADFLVAACSIGYTFVFHDVVTMKRETGFWYVAVGMTWISVVSSLLHVVAITVDRFIATKFPMYHRLQIDHLQVTIGIVSIWIASVVIVISMAWMYELAFWCAALCIPLASVGILLVYSHIAVVSIKRRITDRTGKPVEDITDAPVQPTDIKKSMNTLLLGSFVTLTYVVCNLPLSVAVIRYLGDRICPSTGGKVALQALLTINTVVDPMLYALFDLLLVIKKKIAMKYSELPVLSPALSPKRNDKDENAV